MSSAKKRRASGSEADKETKKGKPSKKSKTETETKELRKRIVELERDLAERSRGVTVIITGDCGPDTHVDVYYSGPEAENAWKSACKDAINGDGSVIKVDQGEPLVTEGQGHMVYIECLNSQFDEARLKQIAGDDSNKEEDENE
jgi:hypothetical protein